MRKRYHIETAPTKIISSINNKNKNTLAPASYIVPLRDETALTRRVNGSYRSSCHDRHQPVPQCRVC